MFASHLWNLFYETIIHTYLGWLSFLCEMTRRNVFAAPNLGN